MKINPIEWAAKIVKQQGAKKAYTITQTVGRERIGHDNDYPNPSAKFYKSAADWIKARFPEVTKNEETIQ